MKRVLFSIASNLKVAKDTFRLELRSDDFSRMSAGQFVEVALEGRYLRRPISVCDSTDGSLTLLYKVVGEGTAQMARMSRGEKLDVLTGLGRGFSLSSCRNSALLLGGGIGIAPMYQLAKELLKDGKKVRVIGGFNTEDEIVLENELKSLGAEVLIATLNGSRGTKGFVTDVLKKYPAEYDYFYVCGPLPMEKAVFHGVDGDGEFSLEERMGCGVGICYGCSVMTKGGARRVCADGPVFRKEELPW